LGRQNRTRGFSKSAIAYIAIPVASPGTAIGKTTTDRIKTGQNGRDIGGPCGAASFASEPLAAASGDNPRSRPRLTLAFIFAPTDSMGLLQDDRRDRNKTPRFGREGQRVGRPKVPSPAIAAIAVR
jgi:hypothetical protein